MTTTTTGHYEKFASEHFNPIDQLLIMIPEFKDDGDSKINSVIEWYSVLAEKDHQASKLLEEMKTVKTIHQLLKITYLISERFIGSMLHKQKSGSFSTKFLSKTCDLLLFFVISKPCVLSVCG